MKNLKKKKNFFLFTSSVTFCHTNVCIVLNWRDFICIRRKRVKRLVKESSGAFIFPANEIFTFYELLKRLWIRYSWTVHIGDIDLRTSCSGRGSVNSEQKDNIHRVFEWKKKKKKLHRFSRHHFNSFELKIVEILLSSTFRINPLVIFVIFVVWPILFFAYY